MQAQTPSLLIVDDESFIRQSLGDFFEDRLWVVHEAESGETAMPVLLEKLPNVVLVDIRLGGMDGDQFIREALNECPDFQGLFVICTGSPSYSIPPDLERDERIAPLFCRKPVHNLHKFEQELRELIKR